MSTKPKRVFLEACVLFLLNFMVVGGVFLASFYLLKNQLHMQAVDVPLIKTGFDRSGLDWIITIKELTPFIGMGIALAYSLLLFVLLLLFTGFRKKSHLATFILNLFVVVIFGLMAIQLVYREPRFTAVMSAIQSFIGIPLGISMIAAFLLCNVWFAIKKFKGAGTTAVCLLAVLGLSGCSLADVSSMACAFNEDSDHCYQGMAVQSGNADTCEKIEGENFTGENPPKDKCYLMNAVNTGDYSLCDKIAGGFMSYTKEECIAEVAISKKDLAACKKVERKVGGLNCASKIPSSGDNPLKEGESIAAEISDIDGDVRIIKEDGRIIPVTQNSVLGQMDRVISMEDSSFTFQKNGKDPISCPPNTLVYLDEKHDTLEGHCRPVGGVR